MKFVQVALALLAFSSAADARQGTMSGSGAVLTQAASTDDEEANARAAHDAQQSGERLICRRIDNTQSRMSRRRICLTARQWRERQ